MQKTISLLEASAEILRFLQHVYNYKSNSYGEHTYPEHLMKHIASIEIAALYQPESILYIIILYDLYLLDVFTILSYYPEALVAMCRYKMIDERSTMDELKEHTSYEYILCKYLEPFRTVLQL